MDSCKGFDHGGGDLMGLTIFWVVCAWVVYKQAMILFDTFTED
jgi:hypothetical protein